MSQVHDLVIKFKQSTSADVVANRIRIRPANTAAVYDSPFQDVTKPTPDADGFTRIPMSSITAAKNLEGKYDVHITALDAAKNESDFLEIDNQTFDLSPPLAPTAGSVE
jgi:hypothetical protein